MRILWLLLMSCLVCTGQSFTFNDLAFVCRTNVTPSGWTDTYYPTNIAGYTANGWWVADNCKGITFTNVNGGVTNWPDYSGNNYNLTNVGSVVPNISNNWMNGRSIVRFSGAAGVYQILRNTSYTNENATSGMEFVFVIAGDFSGTAGNEVLINDSTGGANLKRGNTLTYQAWSFYSPAAWPTNKWGMVNFVKLTTGRSRVYTNGITTGDSADSAATYNGIGLGARYSDGHAPGPWAIAEIVSYHTNLTDSIRSNLFSYFTNKYQFTP